MADLEDKLADIRRNCNHWRRRAEEAEMVSAVSRQQEAAACSLCIFPLPTLRMPLGWAPLPDHWRNVSFLQGEGVGYHLHQVILENLILIPLTLSPWALSSVK